MIYNLPTLNATSVEYQVEPDSFICCVTKPEKKRQRRDQRQKRKSIAPNEWLLCAKQRPSVFKFIPNFEAPESFIDLA